MPEREDDPFDYSLVMSDAEIIHYKKVVFNLQGQARKCNQFLDEMKLRRKRRETQQKQSAPHEKGAILG